MFVGAIMLPICNQMKESSTVVVFVVIETEKMKEKQWHTFNLLCDARGNCKQDTEQSYYC